MKKSKTPSATKTRQRPRTKLIPPKAERPAEFTHAAIIDGHAIAWGTQDAADLIVAQVKRADLVKGFPNSDLLYTMWGILDEWMKSMEGQRGGRSRRRRKV